MMTNPPPSAEPNVGQRLRALREQKGLSLRALAKLSGLSLNAISLIERGENSPTVSSLHALAMALEVSLVEFFQTTNSATVIYTRPETRPRTEAEGMWLESVGMGLPFQQMAPFLLTLAPGAGRPASPIVHEGEEFVYGVAGEVSYVVAGQVYRLTPGCTLLFKAALPHYFVNDTAVEAQLLLIFVAEEDSLFASQRHVFSQSAVTAMLTHDDQ
jgi:transcriptional regulator with XRE-family HTH domain